MADHMVGRTRDDSGDGGGEHGQQGTAPAGEARSRFTLSRRRLLQGVAALSAGAMAGSLWQSAEAAAGPAEEAVMSQVPGLDELAGEWMPVGTLLNLPSVNNFHGGLHAGSNLLSFMELTLPPLSLGGEAARLRLNGVTVQAHESRWYPYQALRRAAVGPLALESTIRMAFEQQLVLLELAITNTGDTAAPASLEVELGGYLRSYPGPWQWGLPRQYGDFSAWHGELAGGGGVLVVADGASPAAAAFAFPTPPDSLVPAGSSGSAAWSIVLRPRERRTVRLLMAAGEGAGAVVAAAVDARARFAALFAHARGGWEQRFGDAFTPGNGHFSGSLPVLVTADQRLRELYYRSVVSVLELERTCYPQLFPRVYVTAGPQWGVTLTYFWDTSLFAPILVLLDPVMAREQSRLWLERGVYNGYAVDDLTGTLVGPWYSANDVSVFTMLLTSVTFTGDMAFLDEQVAGVSVIDHMQAIAMNWQRLAVPATGLADYGARSNLLEEVPNYVNQVPSLNAANVWMMRRLAALRQARGETDAAGQLLQQARQLAGRVLDLYVPGEGVWETVHDDGSRAVVRHVYDFDTIGRLMTEDLDTDKRSEMAGFVSRELLAGGWMRALSLSDPDAAVSLRPDHGSNGAYDAWPALAAGAMGQFGRYGQMLEMLRAFAGVGAEGPFSQSHQLVPEPSGVVVWDRDDLNPRAALTVTAWINATSWPALTRDGSIVTKDAAAGAWYPTTPPNVGYALRGGGEGAISFAVAAGGKFREAVSTATVPVGSWHHVAGTFDGSRLAVYIDGQPAAAVAAGGSLAPSTGVNVMIGADPIDPEGKFSGAIDEVRIYNRALSQAEIEGQYAATDARSGTDDGALVLRLPMDEDAGSSTVDTVTGLAETVIAGSWVPGRYGSALSFARSTALIARVSRQQYNENNGGSFAAVMLEDLFGYAPDGRQIVLRDPHTSRGIDASLRGITWQGKRYTLTSTASGIRLVPGG